jgi:2,3-bisphosphoglycerate-dependent phosphoglycerate mutase
MRSFPRHLILIRHGESALNAASSDQAGIFCGQFETPLTELGRKQAQVAGDWLAARSDLRIGLAISSCLERAKDTLQYILRPLPATVRVLPPAPELNERSLGAFEGRQEEEVYSQFPEYRDDERLRRFRNDLVQKAPGGENLTEVTLRAWTKVEQLLTHTMDDVLIVSHNTTLRCILAKARGLTESEMRVIHIPHATPFILQLRHPEDHLDGGLLLVE